MLFDLAEHPIEPVNQKTDLIIGTLFRSHGIILLLGNNFCRVRERKNRSGNNSLKSRREKESDQGCAQNDRTGQSGIARQPRVHFLQTVLQVIATYPLSSTFASTIDMHVIRTSKSRLIVH